ncbi:transcriptional regulator [Pullulanibacillus camelliae]|uniref:Transcriptional regulator n=1 Tax=Pullulanibacillus camelliae TaxID=1707096 RepID=A0A8J2VHP8_9BACL|nr:ROK family transcriptional regulator [Pullulanibacillus camelliae]GGE30927.1 transcriptional regulator [Pullulanibacillus camelliae]
MKKTIPGTPNLLRIVNRNTLLRLLEQREYSSRSELSQLSGLSLPTVSSVIKDLLKEGWVIEVAGGVSQGGKPPQLIQLDPNARYIAAIQMNQDQIRICLTNLVGQILAEEEITVSGRSLQTRALCEKTARSLKALIERHPINPQLLLGAGVAVPGVVDDQGRVSQAPEFGWDQAPIQDYLSKALDLETVVENDVRLAVKGEAWRRKETSGTMIYVHLSKGIGAGILINGEIYKGAHFAAGEIGNMIVDPQVIKDRIGHRQRRQDQQGFFEEQYGMNALRRYSDQHEGTQEAWILEHLAFGMVNMISVLDPDQIIFGGEMIARIDHFLEKLKENLSKLILTLPAMSLTPLGNHAPLFGATRIVLESQRSDMNWITMNRGGD